MLILAIEVFLMWMILLAIASLLSEVISKDLWKLVVLWPKHNRAFASNDTHCYSTFWAKGALCYESTNEKKS